MSDPTGINAAANVAVNGPETPGKGNSEVLAEARQRLNMAINALSESLVCKVKRDGFHWEIKSS